MIRRQRFTGTIFGEDRFMSSLMSLPYALKDNFNDKADEQAPQSLAAITTQMRALRCLVALVAANVNNRNSSHPVVEESAPNQIQQTLDEAANTLP